MFQFVVKTTNNSVTCVFFVKQTSLRIFCICVIFRIFENVRNIYMYNVLHYNICQYIFVGQEKFLKKAT